MEDANWGALFESYFEGSISQADKERLELQLESDKDLQAAFETYKAMRESLTLRKIKTNLVAQNYFLPKWRQIGSKYWPYVVVLFITIVLMLLWYRAGTEDMRDLSKDSKLIEPVLDASQDVDTALPLEDSPNADPKEDKKQSSSKSQSDPSLQLNQIIAEFMEEGIVMRSDSKIILTNILCVDYLVQNRFEDCLKCIEQDKNTDGLSIDQKEWLKALSYWGMQDYAQAKTVLESISSESLHEYQIKAKEVLDGWPPRK
jgi:hypothetical protein